MASVRFLYGIPPYPEEDKMFRPFNPDYAPRNWKQLDQIQEQLTKIEERMDYLEYLNREWNTDEEREYEELEKQQKELKNSLEIAYESR
jgi:hypothetical protein